MRPSLTLSPVDALVIWQPSRDWDGQPWWWTFAKRWFKPGYGHVLVMFYDPDGDAFVVIDPVYGGIQARAISTATLMAIAGPRTLPVQVLLREYPGTEWRLVVRDRSDCPPILRGPVTCVSVVKSVLGIGGRSWTPYGLLMQIDAAARSNGDQVAQDTEAGRADSCGAEGQG